MTLSLSFLAQLAQCHFTRGRLCRYFVETYLPAMTLAISEVR